MASNAALGAIHPSATSAMLKVAAYGFADNLSMCAARARIEITVTSPSISFVCMTWYILFHICVLIENSCILVLTGSLFETSANVAHNAVMTDETRSISLVSAFETRLRADARAFFHCSSLYVRDNATDTIISVCISMTRKAASTMEGFSS